LPSPATEDSKQFQYSNVTKLDHYFGTSIDAKVYSFLKRFLKYRESAPLKLKISLKEK